MGQLGERGQSYGWTGVFRSLPWAPAAWELNAAGGLGGVTSMLGEIIAWPELCMAVTCVTSKLYL